MDAQLKENLKKAQATLQNLQHTLDKADKEMITLLARSSPTIEDFQETVGWLSALASDAGGLETVIDQLSKGCR